MEQQDQDSIPITMSPKCKVCPPLIVRLPKGISDTPEDPFSFQVSEYAEARRYRVIEGDNEYINLKADNFSSEAAASAVGSRFNYI